MRRYLDAEVTPLTDGWRVAVNGKGDGSLFRSADPDWIPAPVPGTLAAALAETGRFDPDLPHPLQDRDAWYVCDLDASAGPAPFSAAWATK